MKIKICILTLMMYLVSTLTYSQTKVGSFSGSFSIDLIEDDIPSIVQSVESAFDVSGISLDSITIDDQDPFTIDSISYLVLYFTSNDKSFSFGLALTKSLNEDENVDYYINDDETSARRAWSCEIAKECNQCAPKRNWFLGPVVGCVCDDCKFNSSGTGFPTEEVLTLIAEILSHL